MADDIVADPKLPALSETVTESELITVVSALVAIYPPVLVSFTAARVTV